MIRAKFRVETVIGNAGTALKDGAYQGIKIQEVVKMNPVYAADGPNKAWSEATPSGELSMTISNPEAFGRFEVGAEYFLDFTPAQ